MMKSKRLITIRSLSIAVTLSLLSTTSVTHASIQTNSATSSIYSASVAPTINKVDYTQLLEDWVSDGITLTPEQMSTSQALAQRASDLYPNAYYQLEIDNFLAVIDTDQIQTPREVALLQCLTDTNTVDNFKLFTQYFAQMYVTNTPEHELKSDLSMLNHFFIDDLALAVQNGDINSTSADLQTRLRQAGLESEYEAFRQSSRYKNLRMLTGLEGDESQPVNLMIFMFVVFNGEQCATIVDA